MLSTLYVYCNHNNRTTTKNKSLKCLKNKLKLSLSEYDIIDIENTEESTIRDNSICTITYKILIDYNYQKLYMR